MDLTDISRTLNLNTKEYAFFSEAHDAFSKRDHILRNKAKVNKYKKVEKKSFISEFSLLEENTMTKSILWRKKFIFACGSKRGVQTGRCNG